MSTRTPSGSIASSYRTVWNLVRLPLLAALALLAPTIQTVGAGLMLLGIMVALLFKISAAGPAFPFWHIIGISLGFGLFVVLTQALLAFLSR